MLMFSGLSVVHRFNSNFELWIRELFLKRQVWLDWVECLAWKALLKCSGVYALPFNWAVEVEVIV